MKTYVGVIEARNEPRVYVDFDNGIRRQLSPRLDVRNHSPDGLSWGHNGSGTAQCALAILCDCIGTRRAVQIYQEFKNEHIMRLNKDNGWQLKEEQILTWVKAVELMRQLRKDKAS